MDSENKTVDLSSCKDVNDVVIVFRNILELERVSHLAAVDRLERSLGISPRTSELRQAGKKILKDTSTSQDS